MKRLFGPRLDSRSGEANGHLKLPHLKSLESQASDAVPGQHKKSPHLSEVVAREATQSPAAPGHAEIKPAIQEPDPAVRNPETSTFSTPGPPAATALPNVVPPTTFSAPHQSPDSYSEMDNVAPPELLLRSQRTPGPTFEFQWKKLKNSMQFANLAAATVKEEKAEVPLHAAGRSASMAEREAESGPPTPPKGSSSSSQFKPRGRRGMEGLQVMQSQSLASRFRDIYVGCLKMPPVHFLLGVFSSPVLLGLLFTPLYLLHTDGLHFGEGAASECPAAASSFTVALHSCGAALHVFLYALSVSTTFGGSPVAAVSPFTLMVANLNVLCAQFLFVLLSGAVFARMSQPSQPLRCSKKAIIRREDMVPSAIPAGGGGGDGMDPRVRHRVFAMRMVLTGPAPCELLDVRVGCTFRIFTKPPSGAVFSTTRDLVLVRPELAYLRYGLMCRHIIDESSPLHGFSMGRLKQGDASFTVTVVGMERTSMQPVFHMKEYYAFDDDVVWDGDFQDFVYVNEKGLRVLDHTRLDHMKHFKVRGLVSQAISRMGGGVRSKREEEEEEEEEKERGGWASVRERRGGHVIGDISDTVPEISTAVTEITTSTATNVSHIMSPKGSFNRSFSFASWGEGKGKIRKLISPYGGERRSLSMSDSQAPKRGGSKIV